MQARYYDPITSRFLSIDPVGFTDTGDPAYFNRYAYTANNPVNMIDPDGRETSHAVRFEQRAQAVFAGEMTQQEFMDAQYAEGAGVLLAASLLLPGPEDLVIAGAAAKFGGSLLKGQNAASGLGDLTTGEVNQIQNVVDEAGRPLDVVGSAARGERRNVGSDLPIGKGSGTRSDTDFTTASSNRGNFNGLEGKLPNADPSAPILRGTPEAGNPSIRFEPETPPRKIPEN